ncbi:UNVERIFIED_CONTAM: hypothetical protein GTU68_000227 [Idotea baltica]|nr:hypothetical protein [Idotea baltica]
MKKFLLASVISLTSISPAHAINYNIDPAHTDVSFKVRHLGISNVRGQFIDFSGTIEFDPENIEASKTDVTIKTSSIDTKNEKRDKHLRSDDFFDSAKKPVMSFKSTKVTNVKDKSFDVLGDLTLNNITKPVTLAVVHTGSVIDPWGNQRVGFEASASINRKDFGLVWSKVLETGQLVVAKDVQINIALEAIKEK